MNNDQFVTVRHEVNRKIKWLNSSGETVPAWGIVEVVSFDPSTEAFTIQKPTASGVIYFCNSGVDVPDGKHGESEGFNAGPQAVLLDKADDTIGKTVGPSENSWAVNSDGSGFVLYSDLFGGEYGLILDQAASSSSSDFWAITNQNLFRATDALKGRRGLAERIAFSDDSPTELARTGEIEYVYNHYEGIDIAIDTLIRVSFDSNSSRYIIVGADCGQMEEPPS